MSFNEDLSVLRVLVGESRSNDVKKCLEDIRKVFSGDDGGMTLAILQSMLVRLEKQEELGDDDAEKILGVVRNFARLVHYVNSQTGDLYEE